MPEVYLPGTKKPKNYIFARALAHYHFIKPLNFLNKEIH
jgi:hypothetical protein